MLGDLDLGAIKKRKRADSNDSTKVIVDGQAKPSLHKKDESALSDKKKPRRRRYSYSPDGTKAKKNNMAAIDDLALDFKVPMRDEDDTEL